MSPAPAQLFLLAFASGLAGSDAWVTRKEVAVGSDGGTGVAVRKEVVVGSDGGTGGVVRRGAGQDDDHSDTASEVLAMPMATAPLTQEPLRCRNENKVERCPGQVTVFVFISF